MFKCLLLLLTTIVGVPWQYRAYAFQQNSDVIREGDFFFNQFKYKKAKKIYEMSFQENPRHTVKTKIMLCNTLIEQENMKTLYKNAYASYKKEDMKIAKNLLNQIEDNYSLGVIEYENENYDEGIKYFEKEKNSTIHSIEKQIKLGFAIGMCKYKMRNYEDALEKFVEILRIKQELLAQKLNDASEQKNETEDFLRYKHEIEKWIGKTLLFAGECNYEMGRYWEAEKYYISAMEYDKVKQDATYGAGWSRFKVGKYNEAGEMFHNLATYLKNLNDKEKKRLTALYYAGKTFLTAGETKKAQKYFKQLLFEFPENQYSMDTHYYLGKIYYNEENYADSRSEMWLLLKWYHNSEYVDSAYLTIGDAYFAEENYESAIKWYRKLSEDSLSQMQNDARFRIEKARYKLGMYENYIEMLAGFIDKYPDAQQSQEYTMEIADFWKKEKNYEAAIKWYLNVMEKYTDSEIADKAKFNMAGCYVEMEEIEKALMLFGELLGTKLGVKAYFGIANTYQYIGEYSRAITEYKNLIKKYPGTLSARESQYQIGMLYEKLLKHEEAIMAFSSFIEQYPNDSKYWSTKLKIAKSYLQSGDIKSASNLLLKISARGKGEEVHHSEFILGNLYFENSNWTVAQKYYVKSALGYKNIDRKATALLQAAKCALSLNDTEEAKKFYLEVIAIEPNPVIEQEAKKGLERIIESKQ